MKAEFEEKDFEAPLYNELRYTSHRIATPGQVFEGKFGIDAALEAHNPLFWEIIGFSRMPRGVILDDFNWGFVWRRLGRRRKLPNFSINLLVQSKRPDYNSRANSQLSQSGISGKYWFFQPTPHQHKILVSIANRLGNRAYVIYAAAAFDTLDDLYRLTEIQKIMETSSFVRVERLEGHHRWNYQLPGTSGVATSESENIDDLDLAKFLRSLRDMQFAFASDLTESDSYELDENLAFLYKTSLLVCREFELEMPKARYFLSISRRIERFNEVFRNPNAKNYIGFRTFCNVFGIEWFLVG